MALKSTNMQSFQIRAKEASNFYMCSKESHSSISVDGIIQPGTFHFEKKSQTPRRYKALFTIVKYIFIGDFT